MPGPKSDRGRGAIATPADPVLRQVMTTHISPPRLPSPNACRPPATQHHQEPARGLPSRPPIWAPGTSRRRYQDPEGAPPWLLPKPKASPAPPGPMLRGTARRTCLADGAHRTSLLASVLPAQAAGDTWELHRLLAGPPTSRLPPTAIVAGSLAPAFWRRVFLPPRRVTRDAVPLPTRLLAAKLRFRRLKGPASSFGRLTAVPCCSVEWQRKIAAPDRSAKLRPLASSA